MKMYELVETANSAGFQHLVSQYLCLHNGETTWTVEGASITVQDARRRTGIPADARPVRYLVEHPEQGWSFAGRAVWRLGRLFEPKAVHNCIERYWDDREQYGDDNAIVAAVNEWLKAL
ncbi:hypothetical protein [Methylobacterium sp. PvR107]|uniref:hypothetical protein n=1 Tax=Methylobacterium sp. PvR107 TaxID=2806597 RepID=UPI001AEB6543|nr:hypothetical protein [Methylobacterium sp. PvR107]MBP1180911.1 hypothetical protein [Methylobacterium sp. PvR107]